ncbi:MAG: c-type cytochrome [Phycisphaera sp.]|nr:c-type cytochrome [Phycisphaera sp.]
MCRFAAVDVMKTLAAVVAMTVGGAQAAEFTPAPISVPPGYSVEVVAAPPLVKHPMMAGFDDRGRLYVAESAGLNLKREDLEKQLPNSILMLEDTDGDGRFDKSTVFADKLTLPMGAAWLDGALYVASPPYLWRLEDTDGDGVADKRDKILGEFGYTGNAASLHGPFVHPSGRLFFCDGRHGHNVTDASGNVISKGDAARIFSCNPDGTDLRTFAGGGMDNPVELAFTEGGEVLGTVNLMLNDPRGDTLVHYVDGGVYPRFDFAEKMPEFVRTGDLLPAVYNFGHVALSGMCRYRGGPIDNDDLTFFVTQFNTHKVVRVRLKRQGSTFVVNPVADFLGSSSDDFHPTDVLTDADGSLLVVDTGGWFRIGCPQSQTAKPDVLGAIYRIRKTDAATPADPRGLKIDWTGASVAQLITLLDDGRFAVRDRAIAALGARGGEAIWPLKEIATPGVGTTRQRLGAVWALMRMRDADPADTTISTIITEPDESVRLAEIASAARLTRSADGDDADATDDDAPRDPFGGGSVPITGPDKVASPTQPATTKNDNAAGHTNTDPFAGVRGVVIAPQQTAPDIAMSLQLSLLVFDESPAVRRAAVEALGAMSRFNDDLSLLEQLLDDPRVDTDPLMQHAIVHALITMNKPIETLSWLGSPNDRVRRAALIALDKMPAGDEVLTAELIAPLLDTDSEALRRATVDVMIRRGWVDALVGKLDEWLAQVADKLRDPRTVLRVLTTFLDHARVNPLVSQKLGDAKTPPAVRRLLLEAILAQQAEGFDEHLLAAAVDTSLPAGTRIRAARLIAPRLDKPLPKDVFDLLIGQTMTGDDAAQRRAAAVALGAAPLTTIQLNRLASGVVAKAGALELAGVLPAFAKANDPDIGRLLVAALDESAVVSAVPHAVLRDALAPYGRAIDAGRARILDKANANDEALRKRLAELHPVLERGDAQRGAELFFTPRATCTACHRIDQRGGNVGPDLTRIGLIRSPDDLLESIVIPSASFARGYEPVTVTTTSGQTHVGRVARETANELVLMPATGAAVHVSRSAIKTIEPGQASLMPPGLDRLFTEDELADLIAYLRSRK